MILGNIEDEFELNELGEFVTNTDDTLKNDTFDIPLIEEVDVPTEEEIVQESTEDDEVIAKEKDKNSGATPKDIKNTSNKTPSILTDLAKALHTDNILPNATPEQLKNLKNLNDLGDLIANEIKINELASLPDEAKEAFDMLMKGGSWEDIINLKKNEVVYSKLTHGDLRGDDKLELRKTILKKYYKSTTKFSDAKINSHIETAINTGIDETEAMDALDEIQKLDDAIKKEYTDNLENKARKDKENNDNYVKDITTKVNNLKDIDGIVLNEKQKKNIIQSMINPKGTDKRGNPLNEILTDYLNDEQFRINLHTFAVLTNNFTKISAIKSKGVKSELEILNARLANESNSYGRSFNDQNTEPNDILNYLKSKN